MVDVNEITKNAINILKGEIQKRNINLVLNLFHGIPPVIFDSNKLLQVFLNLITNAIESCSHKGIVSISSRIIENEKMNVIWTVEDNGAGISEDSKEKNISGFLH